LMIVEPKSAVCCVSPVACSCAPASAIRNAMNTLEYSPDLCINCGMCSVVCPHAVFAPDGRVARLARPESCMECGACQLNCPTGAITVDSGVGCAAAMIYAALTGRKEPTCGPDPDCSPGCCG
jgi:NAD-dependent dihydropyrimidine dehydrogenase PreA subunit